MISYRILVKRLGQLFLACVVVLYAADYLRFRVRMAHAKPGDPLETLTSLRVLSQSSARSKAIADRK